MCLPRQRGFPRLNEEREMRKSIHSKIGSTPASMMNNSNIVFLDDKMPSKGTFGLSTGKCQVT
jgi:hypothetical protein